MGALAIAPVENRTMQSASRLAGYVAFLSRDCPTGNQELSGQNRLSAHRPGRARD
jgi:hypothetical protein